jgi:predicted SprT family Zn-dependent metalloprotease
MSQQAQIRAKCAEVFAKAAGLYGLDFSKVEIRFDLKGRAAGMAGHRFGRFYLRFNHDMLSREAFDHVLNDTVPHEIAHTVCQMNPMLGRGHDIGWKRVCRALGGSGERCHTEEVVYGKGGTFEYTTSTGHKARFSETKHKRIQLAVAMGQVLRLRRGLGSIDKTTPYAVVGVAGRTLNNPIPKRPVSERVPTKEVPVAVLVPQRVVARVTPPRPAPTPAMYFSEAKLSPEAKALMGYDKPPVPSYKG